MCFLHVSARPGFLLDLRCPSGVEIIRQDREYRIPLVLQGMKPETVGSLCCLLVAFDTHRGWAIGRRHLQVRGCILRLVWEGYGEPEDLEDPLGSSRRLPMPDATRRRLPPRLSVVLNVSLKLNMSMGHQGLSRDPVRERLGPSPQDGFGVVDVSYPTQTRTPQQQLQNHPGTSYDRSTLECIQWQRWMRRSREK